MSKTVTLPLALIGRAGAGKTSLVYAARNLDIPEARAITTQIEEERKIDVVVEGVTYVVPLRVSCCCCVYLSLIIVPKDCGAQFKFSDVQNVIGQLYGVFVVLDATLTIAVDNDFQKWMMQIGKLAQCCELRKDLFVGVLLNKWDKVPAFQRKERFDAYLAQLGWDDHKTAIDAGRLRIFCTSAHQDFRFSEGSEFKEAMDWMVTHMKKMSCFHHSTVITTTNGSLLSLDQLMVSENIAWHVPHVLLTTGLKVTFVEIPNILWVTHDHLVFTKRGLLRCEQLLVGDVVFTSFDESQTCCVKHVEWDSSNGKFFGLNGLESIVLANGIKCSTFGQQHALPATWMSIVGRLTGCKVASQLGDTLLGLANKIGF